MKSVKFFIGVSGLTDNPQDPVVKTFNHVVDFISRINDAKTPDADIVSKNSPFFRFEKSHIKLRTRTDEAVQSVSFEGMNVKVDKENFVVAHKGDIGT